MSLFNINLLVLFSEKNIEKYINYINLKQIKADISKLEVNLNRLTVNLIII